MTCMEGSSESADPDESKADRFRQLACLRKRRQLGKATVFTGTHAASGSQHLYIYTSVENLPNIARMTT